MNTTVQLVREIMPVNFLIAWLMSRACRPTTASPISPSISALGITRFDMKYSMGTMQHAHLLTSIDLYGARVMPMVRDILASDKAGAGLVRVH